MKNKINLVLTFLAVFVFLVGNVMADTHYCGTCDYCNELIDGDTVGEYASSGDTVMLNATINETTPNKECVVFTSSSPMPLTFDCNGYGMIGPEAETPIGANSKAFVFNGVYSILEAGMTVQNCEVARWGHAAFITAGSRGVDIKNNNVDTIGDSRTGMHDNYYGVRAWCSGNTCHDIDITGNHITDSREPIYLAYVNMTYIVNRPPNPPFIYKSEISCNTLDAGSYQYGVELFSVDNLKFLKNSVDASLQAMYSDNQCQYNEFWQNSFLDDVSYNAADTTSTFFDSSNNIGNYWYDHTCTDSDNDGICENAYTVNAYEDDSYPIFTSIDFCAANTMPTTDNRSSIPSQPSPVYNYTNVTICADYIDDNLPFPLDGQIYFYFFWGENGAKPLLVVDETYIATNLKDGDNTCHTFSSDLWDTGDKIAFNVQAYDGDLFGPNQYVTAWTVS